MSTTPTASAHVCTYRIRVAGLEYTGQYVSSGMTVLVAMVMFGTHRASAKKVSP